MKRMLVIAMVAGLALASWPVTVLAQEGKEREMGERLGRMEQQIHQLTERIERAGHRRPTPDGLPQTARQMRFRKRNSHPSDASHAATPMHSQTGALDF